MKKYIFFLFLFGGLIGITCTSDSPQPMFTAAEGRQLATQYCGSCHLVPRPEHLDRLSWKNEVLPRMGAFLGRYSEKYPKSSLLEIGTDGKIAPDTGFFPAAPLITDLEWLAIQRHYLDHAPEQLVPIKTDALDSCILPFTVEIPPHKIVPPSTIFATIRDRQIEIGDVFTQSIFTFDHNHNQQEKGHIAEGIVDIDTFQGGRLITVMGSFTPTDFATGLVLYLPQGELRQARVIANGLKRPVHTELADLDGDGDLDFINAEYGKWTGGLYWWENLGNFDFKKHRLKSQAGALRSGVIDLDKDGDLDIIALFGQGNEGFWIFTNNGEGSFTEKPLLRLPPSYGSTYFELIDWNADGHLDILYTCGDNADFGPVYKPYHGVRIYLNQSDWTFHEAYFYPFEGAYKAFARDFDQDGDFDLAMISFFPNFSKNESFVYLQNEGGFDFKKATLPKAHIGRWITMGTGDLNNDQKPDLVLGNLAFEVVPPSPLLQQWLDEGRPYVLLKSKN